MKRVTFTIAANSETWNQRNRLEKEGFHWDHGKQAMVGTFDEIDGKIGNYTTEHYRNWLNVALGRKCDVTYAYD